MAIRPGTWKFLPRRRLIRWRSALLLAAGALLALLLVPSAENQETGQSPPGPLSKAHASLEGASNCQKCHSQGKAIDSGRCLACHQPIAARIEAKKGVHREVGGECEVCHVEHGGVEVDIRPLDPQDFDHAAETGFPFEGSHAVLAKKCPACHKVRSYLANQRNCGFCHVDYHQGGLGESCETCHTPAGWRQASRAFHKSGVFPLEGRHLVVPCASCHLGGAYKGTPTRCYDCHWIRRQDDRYRTRLGNQCEECHRPVSWTAVSWNHGARTGLALNAAHQTVACDGCHLNGVFEGASFVCYSCHREDYEEASDPNHAQAGFPTTCEACHLPSQTDWDQARFDHVWFPIASGRHSGNSCSACHPDPANFKAFTCLTCHGRGETDEEHRGVAGYVYNSQNCYGCHPQGRE